MIYYTFSFTILICVNLLRSGVTADSINPNVGDGNDIKCDEMNKPGWSILSLANVTLDEWPDCLYSNLDKASVQTLISNSSPNITDATKKGLIGFVQYYVRNGKVCYEFNSDHELLHLAAEYGRTNILKYFVRQYGPRSLNGYRRYPWSPLEEAAYMGRYKLLCEGDRSELYGFRTQSDRTILMSAARNGDFVSVKYLVGVKEVDGEYKKEERNEVLHETVISGSLPIMKYLVEEKGYAVDKNDTDLLGLAAMTGNVDLVKYLVFNEKFNSSTKTRGGETGLHMAALANKLEVVKFFIDNLKYDPLVKNSAELTALHLAVLAGNLPIVKYYVDERNIDLQAVSNDENLLIMAVRCNRLPILRYLIDEKHMSIQTNDKRKYRSSLLIAAVAAGHLNIVKYLVEEKGADLNVKDPDPEGGNLAFITIERQDLDILKYLMRVNEEKMTAQINEPVKNNFTVALFAVIENQVDTVKFLVEGNYISNVNSVLHFAVAHCYTKMIEYLVKEKGFKIDESDKERQKYCEEKYAHRPRQEFEAL